MCDTCAYKCQARKQNKISGGDWGWTPNPPVYVHEHCIFIKDLSTNVI